jgi:hypothetical protein
MRDSEEPQRLLTEEDRFEGMLRKRRFEEPAPDLAKRILSASLIPESESGTGPVSFLRRVFADFDLPRPAFAVVTVSMAVLLLTGFLIGFSGSVRPTETGEEQPGLQAFLHYKGSVPWEER